MPSQDSLPEALVSNTSVSDTANISCVLGVGWIAMTFKTQALEYKHICS